MHVQKMLFAKIKKKIVLPFFKMTHKKVAISLMTECISTGSYSTCLLLIELDKIALYWNNYTNDTFKPILIEIIV